MSELWAQLPDFLGWHLLLTVCAVVVGLAVSIPFGIVASRWDRVAEWVLGSASVVQTIPPLALLALMIPIMHGTIGFLPAFIALTFYSVLPILANTVAGIRGVDPLLTEAAQGLGMSPMQMLRRVQLPLALPVIITGVRTSTVQVVGTATLATPVGCTSLGNYIFQGLETRNPLSIVFGCVAAALLAITMDQIVRMFEIGARRRSRRLVVLAAVILSVVCIVGAWAPLRAMRVRSAGVVVVGSGPFTEQHILNDVLATRLRAAGFAVEQRKGMGETIQFQALRDGTIDVYVDYSGSIWTLEMKRTDTADRNTTIALATKFLSDQYGVLCLGSLGFENAYALAMRRSQAKRLGIKSIADLAAHSSSMKIGGDHQFFGRPEWVAVRDGYGLKFAQEVAMDPTLMYSAAADRAVDVISAYTTDGRILAYDLVVLDDPLHALPPYDAVVLVSQRAATRPGFVDALRPLIGSISLDRMREANKLVDLDHKTPEEAAKWILGQK